jgi:hypothetical protein
MTKAKPNLFGWGKPKKKAPKRRRISYAEHVRREEAKELREFYRRKGGKKAYFAAQGRDNPAVSAAQYRLAEAVAHGTARTKTSMTKAAAQEIIDRTPARLRSEFMRQNPSEAYRAGFAALRAGAARYGTTNLSPSIAQREEWAHAWREFMAGWNAAKKVKHNAGKKSWRKTKKAAHKRLGLHQRKKNPARRNPEEIAAEAYREFHGKDPEKVFDVDTRMHYHSVLAGMARLKFIDVQRADGGITTIHFDKNTHLAENEHQTQLFIVGGDQSVNLKDFGISVPHEMQVLGKAVEIGYFTDKKHLISTDGGKGTYVHPFGYTRNGNGREVKVKQADPPTLIYDTRNKLLSFAGGSYTIKPEGIDG